MKSIGIRASGYEAAELDVVVEMERSGGDSDSPHEIWGR